MAKQFGGTRTRRPNGYNGPIADTVVSNRATTTSFYRALKEKDVENFKKRISSILKSAGLDPEKYKISFLNEMLRGNDALKIKIVLC